MEEGCRMGSSTTRQEQDSLGAMDVPADAYWGSHTQRAALNFPISGYRLGRRFIRALGLVKRAAATANRDLGRLDSYLADLIVAASNEVIDGKLDEHFIVDVFQTGSGTSTNMNANEVIANRAIELAGGALGSKHPVHPNDHVNLGQSSNDVFPSAMHIAAAEALVHDLVPALSQLGQALQAKADAFDDVIKIGRTHLQDATPIRLGQEFGGYAAQVRLGIERAHRAVTALRELAIGGTAVGTGINTHPEFAPRVCEYLTRQTGIEFVEAADHFEAQSAKDAFLEAAGLLRTIAVSLITIAENTRLLSCGPRCGLAEIKLPSIQPGSSIMPGKVNPVMCEMLIQVGSQVLAHDAAIALGARHALLDLNVMMPMMIHNFLESVRLLANGARAFTDKCVAGIEADPDRCLRLAEQSLALATALVPLLGYDRAAEIARRAYDSGKTIRQIALEERLCSAEDLDRLLDPAAMARPHHD
jgi:fumarate hydratase class II